MNLVTLDVGFRSLYLAEGSILLILLAGAVLLYWGFREKYLLPWIAGWIVYTAAKFFAALSLSHGPSRLWAVLAYSAFVLAVGLFAEAVFLYVGQKKLLWPASAVLLLALALGIFAAFWPGGVFVHAVFDYLSWRLIVVVASVQLVRFAWGRLNVGRWLLAGMLLLLHFNLSPGPHGVTSFDALSDLLLGISMMIIVLDDSRIQIQRLDALNLITRSANSQEFGPAINTVLEQLIRIARAKAAWFRILEGDHLVLAGQRGLSGSFVEATRSVDAVRSVGARAVARGEVYILPWRESTLEYQKALKDEGFHHVVLVPVEGKSARIGTLALGLAHFRAHTENEKNFLKATAKQLGLAAENRQLTQQVAQSRNEWASTFDSIPDYILVHDPQNRILRANRALLARLRRSREQVVDQPCESVLPGAGTNWSGCPYCARAEWTVGEDRCFGGYSVVSTSAYTGDASRGGTIHVIKDITETKAAEELYSSLFNHMHEGVFVSTPAGKVVDCNEAFVQMLGYSSKEEILNLDPVESLYVDLDHREKFLSEITRQGYVRNFEYLLRRKDGQEIHVIESSFATRDLEGKIERYQGVVLDVTEMKRAEDEIRRRNRELYVLNNIAVTFNQSFDLDEILQLSMLQIVELLSTDTAGVYLLEEETGTMRKRAAYGHRSSWVTEQDGFPLPAEFIEAIRSNHTEIIDHGQHEHLPEIIQKFIQQEGLRSWLWVILWRKERVLGMLGTSSRVDRKFNASEEGVMIAVGRQLATTIEKIHLYHETKKAYEDLRRTQEQLLQSEKMSAVGQLISGVAHELNNPLTAVLGYAQLLEGEPLEPRIQDFIQKLRKQALRTQKIVQNLLSFGRQHKPSRVHVDLRSVMEDTIALRDYDLKVNNILVQRDFEPVLPSVVADPHQLEQVYLNIINNAADAMLDGSRGGQLRIRIYADDGNVVSEFHDSGPGILEPKRVFDPFYTTKGVGKGTGLGLSICYGIVKEHGGEISARNHADGGALLQVRLPLAVGEKPLSERDRIVARRESRLEGRLLLIDDEEPVLEFEREVFTAAGLKVATATSGALAIQRLEKEEFDAVFLDSKIPGDWSSEEVYWWLTRARPQLTSRTVLVLSNVSDARVRAFVDATKILCLVKPFEVADLLAVVRRLLRRVKVAAQ